MKIYIRRILKIKSSGKPEVESSQPKFTLSRPLNIETKPSEAKEVSFGPPVVTNPPSFVIKTKIETERKEEFNEKKKEKELVRIIQTDENKEMPKFSLFTSNLAVKRPVQEEISPFSFIQTAMASRIKKKMSDFLFEFIYFCKNEFEKIYLINHLLFIYI